jgi:hypothetical protein
MAHSKKSTRAKSTRTKSSTSEADFLYNLSAHLEDMDLQSDFPSLPKAGSPEVKPPLRSPLPTHPVQEATHDQQLLLVQLQKEKLQLELEVLRLRQSTTISTTDTSVQGQQAAPQRKKRTIDWPHEFSPGMSITSDYDKLELSEFVAGFLTMIKPYQESERLVMLQLLGLLMTKATSYSWSSVRSFYAHLSKQVELFRLEWSSATEIAEKAATFFKHSDLRVAQTRATTQFSSQQGATGSPTRAQRSEAEKSCRTWNHTGSCTCDKTNSEVYSSNHTCRVCNRNHPMLHCPKRKTTIPQQ